MNNFSEKRLAQEAQVIPDETDGEVMNVFSRRRSKDRWAFSLVEVTLAVFMIGLGVLTLFSLFPAGLKQSENALIDTNVALFVDKVFSGIRANASLITDWDTWNDVDAFRAQAVHTIIVEGDNLSGIGSKLTITDAVGTDMHISYKLMVDKVSTRPDLRYADLRVCFGERYVEDEAQWFYTEFFYSGLD